MSTPEMAATTGTAQRAAAAVDLAAIRHNARVLCAAAGRAELMAVVKANGYGHGAVAVARAAVEGGAGRLAVATVDEAEEIRAARLDSPLLVMGPVMGDEAARAVAAGADIAVWTPGACRQIAAAASVERPASVHIKIDTGMGRLGVRPEDLPELVEAVSRPELRVVGVMTHFATADARVGEGASFFAEQLLRFRSLLAELRMRFPDAAAHAANSAAVLRGADASFDCVRCGIALYGASPFEGEPPGHGLRPAMRWTSYLAVTKWLRSRESAGYGRLWRAPRGTAVGVVPVGYADGYARALGNVAQVLVNGRRVPVVGAVSMDQLTVDLGPESDDRVGDEVVLLGAQGDDEVTVEELAAWRGTITYEVTCAVGARVRRVHVG